MNLTALIPARGGSKGIPKKNFRKFKGKNLIKWSINQALDCDYINRVIVLTDDLEIAKISKNCGAEIPFLRPDYLGTDESPIIETILYAFKQLPEVSDIILLQPTSPLRRGKDITNIIELRNFHKRDSQFQSAKYLNIQNGCIVLKIIICIISYLKINYPKEDRIYKKFYLNGLYTLALKNT